MILFFSQEIDEDFPGHPVAKALCSQCRGFGFDPWSGNWILHATTKDPACGSEGWWSSVLQLRLGAAKYIKKKKQEIKNVNLFPTISFNSRDTLKQLSKPDSFCQAVCDKSLCW